MPGCGCDVCVSTDKRNTRLRTSILIELDSTDLPEAMQADVDPAASPAFRILVDTSSDLRYQALRDGISRVDAVLYTHTHADHVFGIDELRSFNFASGIEIPIYASEASATELELRFPYAFFPNPNYEGGSPPRVKLHRFVHYKELSLLGVTILPLPVMHGSMEVTAFRIGKFAYVTDCSFIPESSRAQLMDLDVLVLDGLRRRPHRTHFTLDRAVEEIELLRPQKTYLTHISHEIDHQESNAYLKTLTTLPVELAWDQLVISL